MLSIGNYKNIKKMKIELCGTVISLLPPKVKDLNFILAAATRMKNENSIEGIASVAKIILNRNAGGRNYGEKWIEDNLTFDEIYILIDTYVGWITDIQNDPNSKSLTAMRQIAAKG